MTELSIGTVGQIARSVSNIDVSVSWFKQVLQLPFLFQFDTLAFFDCSGTRLMLMEVDEPSSSESVVYFQVPDIGVAYQQLNARGAEFVSAPHMIHTHTDGSEEWMAFFNDPASLHDQHALTAASDDAPARTDP